MISDLLVVSAFTVRASFLFVCYDLSVFVIKNAYLCRQLLCHNIECNQVLPDNSSRQVKHDCFNGLFTNCHQVTDRVYIAIEASFHVELGTKTNPKSICPFKKYARNNYAQRYCLIHTNLAMFTISIRIH
jgi:hypothetical protein